ncbi:MAG: formyltransferase family protein [Thermomicrobiales bacterium]
MAEATGPVRIAVFGMRCAFTDAVVARLLADDPDAGNMPVEIAAFVIAMPGLGALHTRLLGREQGAGEIRILGDRSRLGEGDLRGWLESLELDAVVVACFPWKIPDWVRALAPAGCLNVHPSLLPDGRGPEPLFWAFRWGLAETGVSIHQIDSGWDTGPILAQRALAIPDTATVPSLERSLAEIGGELLREVLPQARMGALAATPQDPDAGRYAPFPAEEDLQIHTSWTAADAARFIRAVVPTYGPVTVRVLATGHQSAVSDVVAVRPPDADAPPARQDGPSLTIAFAGGTLLLRTATAPVSPLYLHPVRSPRD